MNFKQEAQSGSSAKSRPTAVVSIHSLGYKNIGLAEYKDGTTLFIPNTNLGDQVKVRIQKMTETSRSKFQYGIGQVVEVIKESTLETPVQVGQILTVKCDKEGPRGSGMVKFSPNYSIFVPNAVVGSTCQIEITRVKKDYAFAQILQTMTGNKDAAATPGSAFQKGTRFTMLLPKTGKFVNQYLVLKAQKTVFFVKMAAGAKLGEKVRVQIVKASGNAVIAHVIQTNPLSKVQKEVQMKQSLQKMLKSGLHFGEKAVKCHARMKPYLWLRQKGPQKNKPMIQRGRHLVNLLKTRQAFMQTLKQIAKYAAKGRTFLFVGTKKPAAGLIARAALLTQTSFFVNTRWLGGMLTNWKTILKSIAKIRPILKEKQRILKNLLEKRQRIQKRLVKRVQQLKMQSQKLIRKGQQLITKVKTQKATFLNETKTLIQKRQEVLERGQLLMNRQKQLLAHQREILIKTQQLEEKANLLITRKANLIQQFSNWSQKLRELQLLMTLSTEIQSLKQQALKSGRPIVTISSAEFSKIAQEIPVIPNPPKEILNKLVNAMRQKYETLASSEPEMATLKNTSAIFESSTKNLVLTKILSRFADFLPFLSETIQNVRQRLQLIEKQYMEVQNNLEAIQEKFAKTVELNQRCHVEFQLIQTQFIKEREALNQLKTQLQKLSAEQRLLRFLPKLRCLPTPESQFMVTVQMLMKKFVDPKMIYPIDKIYDQKIQSKSKKVAAARKQKWQRLEKYFGGVTKMAKMQNEQLTNNVAIIVGQQEEFNAVLECQKLGIPMISIVDTNCNPGLVNHFIPANDDSRQSIQYILTKIIQHIRLAQKLRQKVLTVKKLQQEMPSMSRSSRNRA